MISTIIDLVTGGLWPYIAAAGAAILGALGLYAKGRSDAKAKAAAKNADAYIKTRERMDHADTSADDAASLRQWLRDRDAKR